MVIFVQKLIAFFREIAPAKDQGRLEKELQSIIASGEEEGLLDPQSGEMIQSILDFRETLVREIMIPRTEIVAFSTTASIGEMLALVQKHGHTRMPVYKGSIDNIVGIINVKDLLKFWSRDVTEDDVLSILRKPYYIPETKNTHQLLHELKQNKYHLAIVIDEYGGTSGLLTLEDLIEEIVGEIHDEHDQTGDELIELSDGTVLANARLEIEALEAHYGLTFDDGKYETLGGLILHVLKRIPIPGEIVRIGPLEMKIEAADERSIKKVRIRKSENR
ncbi:MAG TPA: HlyC/CorC family transporter [Syntrophus sp. (in: bacteria)]|nr:HlyC/CorC family transporter [Syntrophus sp. (in: bacteria)]